MSLPEKVILFEVGPRDGLQNQTKSLTVNQKIKIIQTLQASGISHIEAGSFLPKNRLPQMNDTDKVVTQLFKNNTTYRGTTCVITPNMKGAEKAIACGVKTIAVLASASERFSEKNTRCSIQEVMFNIKKVTDFAKKKKVAVRAYLSCVMGCPYHETLHKDRIIALASQLISFGCYEVSLSDTTGQGTPSEVVKLIRSIRQLISVDQIAVHFHDSYGQGLANVFAAVQEGVHTVDCSIAGLGGCPSAPGSCGNVATEDVLYLLQGANIETGIDLDKVLQASQTACHYLGIKNQSKVAQQMLHKKQVNSPPFITINETGHLNMNNE